MTDAIEAGARGIEQELSRDMAAWVERYTGPFGIYEDAPDPPKANYRSTPDRMAKACIEAAIASGALVPASAVAEMRERYASAIEGMMWTLPLYDPEENVNVATGEAATIVVRQAAEVIRQLDIAPASGDYVVGWRDISTAPSDKEILGFQATAGDHENRVAICWPVVTESRTVWFGAGGLMPTHWQPLPASPMLHAATRTGGGK